LRNQDLKEPSRSNAGGRAILDRAIVNIPDVLADPEYSREFALAGKWRAVLAVPLLHGGQPIGALTVGRAAPAAFSGQQIQLLKIFADQAVMAIENARLFNETKEALERQTATAEILNVIASSPSDVQPVFEAIVGSAKRLLGGRTSSLYRIVDGMLQLEATTSLDPESD
jgi:two-component system NtrC family sensor kinase